MTNFVVKTCLKTIRIRLACQDQIKMTETELLDLQYLQCILFFIFGRPKSWKPENWNEFFGQTPTPTIPIWMQPTTYIQSASTSSYAATRNSWCPAVCFFYRTCIH